MLPVSDLAWSLDLALLGFFASCPKDVLFVLSIMINTAQFESVEGREQEGETEERCGHSQESFSSQQCAPQSCSSSCSKLVADRT